jgi:DNA polymerase I-like protein with 3'-5' exonuclease and polymerase domains
MLLLTAFDYTKYPYKPLLSLLKIGDRTEIFYLYAKGSNRKIYDVTSDIFAIGNIVDSSQEPVYLNDAKSHIIAFNLRNNHNLYQLTAAIPTLSNNRYIELFNSIALVDLKPDRWRNLLGASSSTYISMERKPIFLDEIKVQPIYALDTYTGRSRCHNYNIQGAPEDTPIRTEDADNLFICCDWMAAEIRAAALLSHDELLNESFIKSDPHTMLSEELGIPRDECKRLYMRTIYSIDLDSPILEIYPKLKEWMQNQLNALERDGSLCSPLGRKFKLGSRDTKSVFNAVLQGTVAHAMQSSLIKLSDKLKAYMLTETHDSIIFSCRSGLVPHVIKEATQVMLRPLTEMDTFPLRVYVGRQWKKWKLYREYR